MIECIWDNHQNFWHWVQKQSLQRFKDYDVFDFFDSFIRFKCNTIENKWTREEIFKCTMNEQIKGFLKIILIKRQNKKKERKYKLKMIRKINNVTLYNLGIIMG